MKLKEFMYYRFEKLKEAYYEGLMTDQLEANLAQRFINSGIQLYIDIGANRGDMIDAVISNKTLHAMLFEPDNRMFNILEKKFKDNSKIELYPHAVSNKNGKKKFYFVNDTTQSSLKFNYGTKYYKVKTIKLDNYYNKIKKYDGILIKIDTEGNEPEAFRGMKKIISKIDTRIIIMFEYSYKWLYSEKESFKLFNDICMNGFSVYRMNAFGLELLPPLKHHYLKKFHYSALIAIKNIQFQEKKICLPFEFGQLHFIPYAYNVQLDFDKIEKNINEELEDFMNNPLQTIPGMEIL